MPSCDLQNKPLLVQVMPGGQNGPGAHLAVSVSDSRSLTARSAGITLLLAGQKSVLEQRDCQLIPRATASLSALASFPSILEHSPFLPSPDCPPFSLSREPYGLGAPCVLQRLQLTALGD